MQKKHTSAPEVAVAASPAFAMLAGFFFFLTIVKLGSPAILDRYIEAPKDWVAAFYESWPPHWSLLLFAPVLVAGLFAVDWKRLTFHWVLALPLLWLGWVLVSATHTVSPVLTKMTVIHFAIGVSLFYLGYFARKGMSNPWPVWAGMALALCWAMRAGIEQHCGGLEATRKMIASSSMADIDPRWLTDPEYLARINSNRIFGTFGNPNTLAGGIVLLLPLTLVFLWRLTPKVRDSIRILFVLILGGCGLSCLYWSGSKAGWLVALVVGLVALGHSTLPWKWKRALIYAVLVAGVAGFAFKYSAYFHKERNSVGARFAYWRAALVVINRHPLFGTGPGTFQIPYAQIKRPGDEMSKLCHNDFLEQASDSGVVAGLSYTGMVFAILLVLYRYTTQRTPTNWLDFAIWLGVFGLWLHSVVDFHLYVAALACPLFFLCGWLLRSHK